MRNSNTQNVRNYRAVRAGCDRDRKKITENVWSFVNEECGKTQYVRNSLFSSHSEVEKREIANRKCTELRKRKEKPYNTGKCAARRGTKLYQDGRRYPPEMYGVSREALVFAPRNVRG
jgi:hypothetical protein